MVWQLHHHGQKDIESRQGKATRGQAGTEQSRINDTPAHGQPFLFVSSPVFM